jgi:hypothetical protein
MSFLKKIKGGLCDLHALSVSVYPSLLSQLLNARTNLYETWYVYHGTWARLSGVLRKSFPSVCAYVYPPIVARQRLGKDVPAATYTRNKGELLDALFSMRSVSYQRRVLGSVYPAIMARHWLGTHVPAATTNWWRRLFLCGPCHQRTVGD